MFANRHAIPVDNPWQTCVWLLFSDVRALEEWRPFVDVLDAGLTRSPLRMVGKQDELSDIRRVFPHHQSMPVPRERWWNIRRAFMATRPRAIVHVGDPSRLPPVLAYHASTRGTRMVLVEKMENTTTASQFVVRDIAATGADRRTDDMVQAASGVLRAIVPRTGQSNEAAPDARIGFKRRLMSLRPIERIVLFRSRRIETLEALGERLDRPDTIACLGSGPSSEDSKLLDLAFDSLFRVNLRWLYRGFLDDPDVILSVRADALRATPNAIIGIRSTDHARRMLAGRYPFRIFTPVVDYFALAELPLRLNDRLGEFLPSTGALMLDLAVALRPKRLIIAGFDLFMHPDGSYPGDSSVPNAFALDHDADFDVDCIADVLGHFEGEIVVVGDILRERLAAKGIILHSLT